MSGTSNVKPPKNDAEFARNMDRRVNAVENPVSQRVGDWVLSTNPDTGDLLASHVDGGSTVLSRRPISTQNPDDIADVALPNLKIRRVNPQGLQGGSTVAVDWDTIDTNVGGWGLSNQELIQNVTIPRDGTYLIIYKLAWVDSANSVRKAFLRIDGNVADTLEYDPDTAWFQTLYIPQMYELNAGQQISCLAYTSGSSLLTAYFGASSPDPSSFTSLSITCLR